MNDNLEKIIIECQSGNIKEFKKIFDLFSKKAFNISYRILENSDLAKDIVQETFIKVFKKIKLYKFESSFYTWFYRILINTIYDELRKKKKTEDIENLHVEIKEYSSDIIEILNNEISNLSDQYRTVFILYELEGFSHNEISSILGISVGTSKSNLNRAKEILRKKLEILYNEVI